MPALRPLNVDLDELVSAMDTVQRMSIEFYLDTQTGQTVVVGEDLDEDDELREQIEADDGGRFVHIPENDSSESYGVMEDFIETVTDATLQDRLRRAIGGKGAFRRFKDTLLEAPTERERWFKFSNERQRRAAVEWLAELGIESTWSPPSA